MFVNIILPLALPRLYTYAVTAELHQLAAVGKRVVVQFGKKKIYTAIIENVHSTPPESYKPKNIISIFDEQPIINEKQLEFWKWIASYYMCTLGEVMIAAIPSGLKLESETKIEINPVFNSDYSILTDKEYMIIEALELNKILTITEISGILDQKTVLHIVNSLITKRAVLVREELMKRYKPKHENFVRLSIQSEEDDVLKEIFRALEKAPKQLELLMTFMSISKKFSDNEKEVSRPSLIKAANASSTTLNELVKKGIFEIYEQEVGRLGGIFKKSGALKTVQLSSHQNEAFEKIKNDFSKKNVVLLHGVTGSGKTEIYIRLIEETISQGKQSLYLLPEIALTTQIITRLRKHFGEKIGIYHSKFNDNERVEIWNAILNNHSSGTENTKPAPDIILGARSASFLPFSNLGLIIVDEEHDYSYKQAEPAPRYNARDTAIYLAGLHGAKTVIGSATPSLESFLNMQNEKYGFAQLTRRYEDVMMPEILVVDIKEESRKKKMKSHFSSLLVEIMEKALSQREQVILFQNRRGFSPFLQCGTCGWTPQCVNCDVSLTYHKAIKSLKCHYCGYSSQLPQKCGACGEINVQTVGFGTEKIQEELGIFFPKARVSRMDLDTTRSKYSYQQIISDFENRKVDILVGTQMVTKGLDFDNVSVVGILNADNMLSFPDFRAFERSFQLMAQVSGRAGRKKKQGRVVIQTYTPNHTVIQNVISNDYKNMFENEMIQRSKYKYPPYCRLLEITTKHKKYDMLNIATDILAAKLREKFGKRLLGPESPPIGRVRNLYQKKILLKIEKEASVTKAKKLLQEVIDVFRSEKSHNVIRIQIDVDPL